MGLNAPSGCTTKGVPVSRFATIEPSEAMWKNGAVTKPTSASSCIPNARMTVSACACRFAPLGRPVVPDVYMISAVLVLGDVGDLGGFMGCDEGFVAEVGLTDDTFGGVAEVDDGRHIGERGHRTKQRQQRGVDEDRTRRGVTQDLVDLRWRQPEVDRHRDGADAVDREHRLDERRVVE